LKHNVHYTGAVTEGQQTSNNFHRPMLHLYLITNLLHQLLFIHKILYSPTCFEP